MKHITKSIANLIALLGFLMISATTYAQQSGSCISGDCYNGVGTYHWQNGEKYEGSFRNSLMHGSGTYNWPNGHSYTGNWQSGRQHGIGTYYWASGRSQYAEWQHGRVIKELTAPATTTTTTTTTTTEAKTSGCMSGNCDNGQGLYIWATGERYEGSWQNGKFEGRGSYTWSDGSKYSGNWQRGQRNGQGTFYAPNGTSKTGTWQNNELGPIASPTTTTVATKPPTTTTKPPTTTNTSTTTTATTTSNKKGCVKGDCRNGVGIYVWNSGQRYEGNFKGSKQNGAGTYYWPDGSKYVGEWKNAQRHGRGIYFFPDMKRRSGVWSNGVISQEIAGMTTPSVPTVGGSSTPTTTVATTPTTTSPTTTTPTTGGADRVAPQVTITEPTVTRGFSVVAKGNTLRVRGYAIDESGVGSVWVGGVQAALSRPGAIRTDFDATVTLTVGQRDLWVEATDLRGNEYTNSYTLKVQDPLAATDKGTVNTNRIALVIGNSSYNISPLPNARNDADSVAQVLKETGFEVLHHKDLNYQQMEAAIDEYGEKLRSKGGVGMFYFAGHGVQVDGENYLVPVSASIKKEKDIKYKSVHLGYLLDEFDGAGNDMNIIVLDACRDNPFAAKYRSARNGLAGIAVPPVGTFIAYATSPGSVASDGEGMNGLYTQELIKALRYPGLKIEDVFKVVRSNVRRLSSGMQVPWENSSIEGNFYFKK